MKYDSKYWQKRILAKYTTGLTKQQIIKSFTKEFIEITDDIVEMANSYLLSIPYRPYGKPLNARDTLNEINRYAKIYHFKHNIILITKQDLLSAISNQK